VTTSILAVCTGNVCRSPAVERLLLARLAPLTEDVAVTSAGTHALVGRAVDPPMADLISRAGGVPTPFAARQLQPAHLRHADLVLVMTRTHRSAVVTLEPAAIRRTFLLRELAGIASAVAVVGWPDDVGEDPAARLAMLPRLAAAHRGHLTGPADREVPDPFRQPASLYLEASELIRGAVDLLVAAVGSPGSAVTAAPR
jgi:protein-tyrosine phosphatase